jgi:hypothetical protein
MIKFITCLGLHYFDGIMEEMILQKEAKYVVQSGTFG